MTERPCSFRRFLAVLAAAALYVPLMLEADGPELPRQIEVGAVTGLVLWAMVRALGVPGLQVTVAIAIATAMELVGSLGWGLYRYHHAAIPFYVPFGHGMFYALAFASARQEPLVRRARLLVRLVLAAGTAYVLASLVLWRDVSGLVMWGLAAAIITSVRMPLLMASCCVYTIALEWLGTGIGNWRWAAVVPLLRLPSANPPSGVGIAYCLVDLMTVAACSSAWYLALERRAAAANEKASPGLEGEPGLASGTFRHPEAMVDTSPRRRLLVT